jgi:tetratricopeptide (TPR) repeat protein
MLVIMCALPVVNMASQYHKHDRSNDLLALEYAENFLNGLDENAIIFTNGDNDTFPLWYAQAVYDPYADEYYLEKDTLKFIEIKGFHSEEIPEPPAKTKRLLQQAELAKKELKGIRKDVSVANLSLLNTPWYIKQLRDQEGIEINLTDEQIDRIASPRGIFRLANDAFFRVGDIRITLPKDKIMYTKDQMVLQIINDNFGERPIYFAVTVGDRVGFDNYLQREGMADKLVETRGSRQLDYKRLIHNLENVFDFTTALNDNVYKDSHKKRLLSNYAGAFIDASNYFYQQKNYEKAAEYYAKGIKLLPEENKEQFIPGLSSLYAEMGDFDRAFSVIQPLIEQHPDDDQLLSLAVYYLENAGKIDSAFTLVENFIKRHPTNQYFINQYVSLCQEYQKHERGIQFLDSMARQYPQNNVYLQQKSKLEQSLQEAIEEEEE